MTNINEIRIGTSEADRSTSAGALVDRAWEDRAACKGVDTNIFYPQSEDPDALAKPKAICAQCPVSAQCHELGMSVPNADEGIYGGLSPKERRGLKRRRLAIDNGHGSYSCYYSGCRCTLCKKAGSDYNREARKRRLARENAAS